MRAPQDVLAHEGVEIGERFARAGDALTIIAAKVAAQARAERGAAEAARRVTAKAWRRERTARLALCAQLQARHLGGADEHEVAHDCDERTRIEPAIALRDVAALRRARTEQNSRRPKQSARRPCDEPGAAVRSETERLCAHNVRAKYAPARMGGG